jgi:hypothetical protein
MIYYTRYPIKGGQELPKAILSNGTEIYYSRWIPPEAQPLARLESKPIIVTGVYHQEEVKVKGDRI